MRSISMKERFVFIDALRGMAALSVVLFHTIETDQIPALKAAMPGWFVLVLEHGNLGVAIFFVLSGFVIAFSLDGRPMSLPTVGRFMLRRSVRLDPPYWLAIIITISFSVLASTIVKGRPVQTFSAEQILAHLFYVQNLLGYENINPVFWTLCLEIQFYLIFALLLTTGRAATTLTIGAMIVSLLWPLGIGTDFWPGLFPPLWHGFLLGVAVYWALRGKLPTYLFGAYVLIIGAAAITHENSFSIVCAATAVVIFAVGAVGRLHLSLNWRWLQGLGAISYSLYLIHNPITGATFRFGKMLGGHTITWDALWWLLSIFACIAVAVLIWILIERPSTRLARKIPLRRESALPISSGTGVNLV
jgi:peptidoglycan/LPS O-acetylase OafA/YrhL